MSGGELPSREDVRDRVIDALKDAVAGAGVASGYDAKAKADDFFEAFLFVTLLEEADDAGWGVKLVDTIGDDADELLLRAGPGSLAHPSDNYTHAVLSRPGAFDLEVHVGVRVRGESGVMHEADVLVLPRAVAEACRKDGTAPRVGRIVSTFEAKFIDAGTVPLGWGRAAVGLDTDMDGVPYAALVTTRPSGSVDRLLAYWRIEHIGELVDDAGAIDEASLREYFQELLDWWGRSGRWWESPPKQRRRRRR